MKEKKEFDLFDKPATRKLLWKLLWGACALSVLLEFFVHRHPHFKADAFFGFYAVLGFVACTAMILLAKALGVFLKVPEDYYDEDDDDESA